MKPAGEKRDLLNLNQALLEAGQAVPWPRAKGG